MSDVKDDELLVLPKRDLRGLYWGLGLLLLTGLAFGEREYLPQVLEGRYVPYFGYVYPFPGAVNAVTPTGIEDALHAFNQPWVELFLIEQRTRLGGEPFARDQAETFLEHVAFDPTLHAIMADVIELMPFDVKRYESIRHQFEVLNRYFEAANIPIRMDPGLSWTERAGERTLRFLPGMQRSLGALEVSTAGGAAELLVLDRLDTLTTGSNLHGVAFLERMEGWLLLESMRMSSPRLKAGLMLDPPVNWIKGQGETSAELMFALGEWMAAGYRDERGEVDQSAFFLDLAYGVAIHEARHLADATDEPVLTDIGRELLGGFRAATQRRVALEVRAYWAQLIECEACVPTAIAHLVGSLPRRAEGSNELYGAVAHYVLLAIADPEIVGKRGSAKELFGVIQEIPPRELFKDAQKRARMAYELNFGSYDGVSVDRAAPALKQVARELASTSRAPSCDVQSDFVFLADRLRRHSDYEGSINYFEQLWHWNAWRCRKDISRKKLRERYALLLAHENRASEVIELLESEKHLSQKEQKALFWARLLKGGN